MKLICILFCFVSQVSLAQNADTKGLFDIMSMDKLHQKNVEKLTAMRIEVQPELKPHAEEIKKIFEDTMSWKELQPEAESLFNRNFSRKEIEDLKKFYSTSVGKKSLDLMPRLLTEVFENGRTRTEKEIEKFIESLHSKKKKTK